MKQFIENLDKKLSEIVFDENDNYEAFTLELEIAEMIIEARKEMNMTQNELAKNSGVQQANISKIENGIGNPSVQILKRLADGIGKKLIIRMV